MGVEGLYKFINKNFPEIFHNISITDIKNRSCIIDGMQHIYSQLIYMRTRDKEIITSDGKNISHIHGLINSLTYYLKNGIIPIFIFDGKMPDIKKKKIDERKKLLRDNLMKMKQIQEERDLLDVPEESSEDEHIVFGTPPTLSSEQQNILLLNSSKRDVLQEEYKRIYKKSIVMKDYFIQDWIEILSLLGIPVIKAEGEADPLCAYILKNNPDIYGIISDDSDMLVFGAPVLMRKSYNQQFTTIKLNKLLTSIKKLLYNEFGHHIDFDLDNLIDFSILLGTDYGTFKTKIFYENSNELLKMYVANNKDYTKIISSEEHEMFDCIKTYYKYYDFDPTQGELLRKPVWAKPDFISLKKRLLELDVDEYYIDSNNSYLDMCYNKMKKNNLTNSLFSNNCTYNYTTNYKNANELFKTISVGTETSTDVNEIFHMDV